MDWIFDVAFLAILFPIIGLLLNAVFGQRLSEKGVGLIACSAAGSAFVVSVLQLVGLLASAVSGTERFLYEWVSVGNMAIPIAVRIDPLSVTMMLVVTGVGSIIHIYAVGYMRGDSRFQRFFVYFNLFLASMLILVMANNYVMMFIGWELVGLCSYLLIGFWFEDADNAVAGKKAFVVNRVGDFGFMLGVFLIFLAFGTYEFTGVFETVEHGHEVHLWGLTFTMQEAVTAITLLLFIGATGKSAQIPVFVWLPDAMAGPTPVSALIHAATMVTAGIYMVTRSAPMYELATFTSAIIAIIGTIVILALAPGQSEAPPSTIVTYAPGIPTPTTSLPVSGASSGSIPCQPGIEVGKTAVVVYDAVRMRQSPGYVGKNDAVDTVRYLEKGDTVNVNGGPEQKDGLCWWLVVQAGVQGWSADHSSDGTLLLSAGS